LAPGEATGLGTRQEAPVPHQRTTVVPPSESIPAGSRS
jgi:hypothetical protein